MEKIIKEALKDKKYVDKNDFPDFPTACQYKNLCSNDSHRIRNENVNWLKEKSDLPLWSQLKHTNLSKDKNYNIEIPGRLLSLFGSSRRQKNYLNKMKNMENYQLISSILAICAALKYRFQDWSEILLDAINKAATEQYPELLKKLSSPDKEINICSFSHLYKFNGNDFDVQLQQVALGYLYIRFGLNEFNLARALTWFFNQYQFGLLQCCNRYLAFGHTLDTDYGFFMFDCQSQGFPLFKEQEANSYILRTHHLQILLYCLIMTLNVSTEMVNFFIYNVDVRIFNPLEKKCLKKEIYVPTIVSLTKKSVEKKVDCGPIQKSPKPKPINTTGSTKSKNVNSKSPLKRILSSSTSLTLKNSKNQKSENKAKLSKSETLTSQEICRKILLDPSKTYYIIAVPKQADTALGKSKIKPAISSKEETCENIQKDVKENRNAAKNLIKVNIHRINTLKSDDLKSDDRSSEFVFQNHSETLYLEKSASTATLTPNTVNSCAQKSPQSLDSKVYLVNQRNTCDSLESDIENRIKMGYQLKHLFTN